MLGHSARWIRAAGVRLSRAQRSVRLYTAEGVPEKFGCRVGERKSCIIPMYEDPREASACLLMLSTKTEHHAAEVNWPGPALLVEHPC